MVPSGDRASRPTRRRILQTTAGVTAIGVLGNSGSMTVAADPGTEQWAVETGDVRSSPTVVDGTVFVGSADNHLYAVDAATGEQEWAFETRGWQRVTSSPTVVDGTVFVGSKDNHLYAVDAATGEEQWAFETGDSVSSSPTVVNGTVFVGSYDDNLYAVDAATGEEQWVFETGDWIQSSPTVVDGTVFVGGKDNHLHAVDETMGEREWVFETDDSVFSSPTVADGIVFVGSADTNLYAVDAATGEQEWVFETGDMVGSSPTVADGTVFVGSNDAHLYAVNATTGEQDWAVETGEAVFSSPTVADGIVCVGSWDNNLYALNATTGEEQWVVETGGLVFSSPTVVDGTVFVGSYDDNLYALDADVEGSSEGSRVHLGTLGHHDNWRYAGQSIDISAAQDSSETDNQDSSRVQRIVSTNPIAVSTVGTAVTIAGGSGLYRWRSDPPDDSSDEASHTAAETNRRNPDYNTLARRDALGIVPGVLLGAFLPYLMPGVSPAAAVVTVPIGGCFGYIAYRFRKAVATGYESGMAQQTARDTALVTVIGFIFGSLLFSSNALAVGRLSPTLFFAGGLLFSLPSTIFGYSLSKLVRGFLTNTDSSSH